MLEDTVCELDPRTTFTMASPTLLLVLLQLCLLAASPLLATSVFKYPQERQLIEPLVPQCPDDYDEVKPWYEDPIDCNCYYVCDMYGGMVRMCCPAGLWFDASTMNCHYVFSFTKEKQAQCLGNLRGEGSTKQLKEIFLGRCWEYQLYRNPEPFKDEMKDCNALFEKFVQVFFKKEACGAVSMEDYDAFLDAAQHRIPDHKQMFWSGTFAVTRDYCNGGKRMMALEDTLAGFIVNDLAWCGSGNDPGINYEACPPFGSCDGEAMFAFWGRASEKYASLAAGSTLVMLNGSIPGRPAYRNTSFFAQHEIVNFNVPQLHTLKIWVLHDLDKPATETCNYGSVQVLQEQAAEMGLNVICEDNPAELHAMLCVDKANYPECAMYNDGQDPTAQPQHIDAKLAPPQIIIHDTQEFADGVAGEAQVVDKDYALEDRPAGDAAAGYDVDDDSDDGDGGENNVAAGGFGVDGDFNVRPSKFSLRVRPSPDGSVFEPEH